MLAASRASVNRSSFCLQRLLRLFALGDVPADIERGPSPDRDLLDVDEQGTVRAFLGHDLVLDIPDLALGRQLLSIDQLSPEKLGNAVHRTDLVGSVSENHVDIGADVGEHAVIVGDEHGVRHVDQRDAVQLLRLAQRQRNRVVHPRASARINPPLSSIANFGKPNATLMSGAQRCSWRRAGGAQGGPLSSA